MAKEIRKEVRENHCATRNTCSSSQKNENHELPFVAFGLHLVQEDINSFVMLICDAIHPQVIGSFWPLDSICLSLRMLGIPGVKVKGVLETTTSEMDTSLVLSDRRRGTREVSLGRPPLNVRKNITTPRCFYSISLFMYLSRRLWGVVPCLYLSFVHLFAFACDCITVVYRVLFGDCFRKQAGTFIRLFLLY